MDPHPSRGRDDDRLDKQERRPRKGREGGSFWDQLHKIAFSNDDDPVFYATKDNRAWSLNLATLQRVRTHALRHALCEEVKQMKTSTGDDAIEDSYSPHGQIDSLLHMYCDAIRDYDYMRKRGGNDKGKDPFHISTTRQLDRALLYDLDLIVGKCEKARDYTLALPTRGELDVEDRLTRMIERTGGAAASIVALFGPVLIMIFVPTLAATLAVAFASVLVVVVAVAAFTELPANDVMALSFTYAAVLVVFIGTTLSPTA